jgi:hypothetical protein
MVFPILFASLRKCTLGVVVDLLGMAVAVDFDDKMQFTAVEVDDVGADGLLAVEFVMLELLAAQQSLPDQGFGRGGIFAVFTGKCG